MSKRTVEVEMLSTTFTCEVEVYGPTVDDWQEISIRSEEDLIEILQSWSHSPEWVHYDELLNKITEKLREEGFVQ